MNRCVFGESHQIFDIPANFDTFMIFEVQLPSNLKVGDNESRTESYGWSLIDLFD